MFEYLMPLLFQRSYGNSLLEQFNPGSVAIQIAYGRKHHAPGGFLNAPLLTWTARRPINTEAFGVPELGAKARPG